MDGGLELAGIALFGYGTGRRLGRVSCSNFRWPGTLRLRGNFLFPRGAAICSQVALVRCGNRRSCVCRGLDDCQRSGAVSLPGYLFGLRHLFRRWRGILGRKQTAGNTGGLAARRSVFRMGRTGTGFPYLPAPDGFVERNPRSGFRAARNVRGDADGHGALRRRKAPHRAQHAGVIEPEPCGLQFCRRRDSPHVVASAGPRFGRGSFAGWRTVFESWRSAGTDFRSRCRVEGRILPRCAGRRTRRLPGDVSLSLGRPNGIPRPARRFPDGAGKRGSDSQVPPACLGAASSQRGGYQPSGQGAGLWRLAAGLAGCAALHSRGVETAACPGTPDRNGRGKQLAHPADFAALGRIARAKRNRPRAQLNAT